MDWLVDLFASLFDMIPKIIYLLYTSMACLLDFMQLAFRKLAGLDVYYDANGNKISGDIVTNFIAGVLGIDFDGGSGVAFDYSILTTVFWSFVLFGVIITFVSVFVALIKSHYNYDEKSAKGPMQHVYAGLKAILNIFVVPLVVVLGLYVSQAVLTALDSISSGPTAATLTDFDTSKLQPTLTTRSGAVNTQDAGERTYIYYDIFGMGSDVFYGASSGTWEGWRADDLGKIAATTQTFSGMLFRVAAYNANRARTGQIQVGNTTIYGLEENGIFSSPREDSNVSQQESLANMIDTAFVCDLHLSDDYLNSHITVHYDKNGALEWTSLSWFTNFLTGRIAAFSKFNVGAVWYYYDLWKFNFIVGFGGVIVCITLFLNIILGLITRIFMCLGLFLVAPPMFGLSPLDGPQGAAKRWREAFLKQLLMVYGAILGMNIFFLILPLMNQINFFDLAVPDYLMQVLVIIVGLVSVKAFIAMVSSVVGSEDANKTGGDISKDVGTVAGKAAKLAIGTPVQLGVAGARLGGAMYAKTRKNDYARYRDAENRRAEKAEAQTAAQNKLLDDAFRDKENGVLDEAAFKSKAMAAGMTAAQANAMYNAVNAGTSKDDVRNRYSASGADAVYSRNAATAAVARHKAQKANEKIDKFNGKVKTRMKNAKLGAQGVFSGIMKTFSSVQGVKDFGEVITPPTNWEKEAAKTQKKILDEMAGNPQEKIPGYRELMQNQTNATQSGLGTVAERVSAGNRATMAGNAKLENISAQTDYLAENAQQMGVDLTTVRNRVILANEQLDEQTKQLADANSQLADVVAGHEIAVDNMVDEMERAEKLQATVEEANKKLEQIKNNTKKP